MGVSVVERTRELGVLVLWPGAAAIWLGLVALVSSVATLLPAYRASRLVIWEALVQT